MKNKKITINTNLKLLNKLEKLAKQKRCSFEKLINEALKEYLEE